jgi:phosphoribosylglycinamide formyltransferase-1
VPDLRDEPVRGGATTGVVGIPDDADVNLGLLASHGGTNVQAHLDAWSDGATNARPVVVISNNSGSGALGRASKTGIPAVHLSGVTHPDGSALDAAIRDTLVQHNVEVVALCGYMKRIGPLTLERFAGRILNVHPGPLPAFGGQGMYGLRVHEAVIAAGLDESEVCIFVVEAAYDEGPVIARRSVPVLPDDDPETLAARMRPVEHELYVDTVRSMASHSVPDG